MERRRKARIALTVAGSVVACVLVFGVLSSFDELGVNFFGEGMFTKIPASALQPPTYPGAKIKSDTNLGDKVRCISMLTPDTSARVSAFYNAVLKKDGWVNPLVGDSYPPGTYAWDQGGPDGPTDIAFRMFVSTTAIDGKTHVAVQLMKFDPRFEQPPQNPAGNGCAP